MYPPLANIASPNKNTHTSGLHIRQRTILFSLVGPQYTIHVLIDYILQRCNMVQHSNTVLPYAPATHPYYTVWMRGFE